MTCARTSPAVRPIHLGRSTSAAIRQAAVNGASRMARSRFIHAQLSGIAVSTRRVELEMDVIELDLFYDYNCPFVYRAAKTLEVVGDSGERALKINWRYFSLSQVNHRAEDADLAWTVWSAPASETVKGRLAFMAAEGARRRARFAAFHTARLDGRHRARPATEAQAAVDAVAR